MKTLKISINLPALDTFIYSGYLFIITDENELISVRLSDLTNVVKNKYPKIKQYFDLLFFSDYHLRSKSTKAVFKIPEFRFVLNTIWSEFQNEIYYIEFRDIEPYCSVLDRLPGFPLSMDIYNMKLLIGTDAGLYETNLKFDNKFGLECTNLNKVFDAKVVNIVSKCNYFALSANEDGLFEAVVSESRDRLKVPDKQKFDNKSIRSAWASYDLINYSSQNHFEFIHNKIKDVSDQSRNINRYYDSVGKKQIEEFCTSVQDMCEVFRIKELTQDEIIFAFNSNQSTFIIYKNGDMKVFNFKTNENYEMHLSSRELSAYSLSKIRPYSSAVVPNGCVIEYNDQVCLIKDSEIDCIENTPIVSMRSYMQSLRYKNIVTTATENSINIHSVNIFNNIRQQKTKFQITNSPNIASPPIPNFDLDSL